MNRTKKIWLGVLSFSPLVLTTIFICIALLFYMKIVFGAINGSLGYSDEREFIILLIFMIIFGFLVNIAFYATLIIFTICIVKNKRIGDTAKILYLIGMYFLYTIIPIVYFFIEIVSKKEEIEKNERN